MTETGFAALTEEVHSARDAFAVEVAGLRADLGYYKQRNTMLVDEIAPLREQMTAPTLDDCYQFDLEHDGANLTISWSRHARWNVPEVIAIHHGACCIYGAWGAGFCRSAPEWAIKAVAQQIADEVTA